jgi:WD40 repeat protein
MAHLPELGDQIVELGKSGRHSHAVVQLAITPDDRWLVSSAMDGMVLRWNLEDPSAPPVALFHQLDTSAHRVALSSDGKLVAIGTGVRSGVQIVPIEGGAPVFEAGDAGTATGLAFDGEDKLWVATTAGDVELYDIAEQERIWSAPLTPGDNDAGQTEWEGALIGPKWVLFRPHPGRWTTTTSGPSLAFTLPSGRPMAKIELDTRCRPFGQTEVVCPGSVRAKLDNDPQHVVRFLDVVTGRVRLLKVPSPVLALTPNHDRSAIVLAVTSAEKSPNLTSRSSLLVIEPLRGEELGSRPLPESGTSIAMTKSGHVLVGHASGAIRMLKP